MKSKICLVAAVTCCFVNVHSTAFAENTEEQKAVLVTGASSGIGLSIAELLAANGFYVYAGARKAADLERLDAMDNISSVRLDVTVQEDIDSAVAFVESEGRGLWGIVNNAGVYKYSPLTTGPVEDARFVFEVNFFGPYRINQAFLPLLGDDGGRTTIIGSVNGFAPDDTAYTASKFAVEGYTDSLADVLEDTNVHVSIVEPGAYKSAIRRKAMDYMLESSEANDFEVSEELRKDFEEWMASNEGMKEPDDVAEAVLHIMSSESPKRR